MPSHLQEQTLLCRAVPHVIFVLACAAAVPNTAPLRFFAGAEGRHNAGGEQGVGERLHGRHDHKGQTLWQWHWMHSWPRQWLHVPPCVRVLWQHAVVTERIAACVPAGQGGARTGGGCARTGGGSGARGIRGAAGWHGSTLKSPLRWHRDCACVADDQTCYFVRRRSCWAMQVPAVAPAAAASAPAAAEGPARCANAELNCDTWISVGHPMPAVSLEEAAAFQVGCLPRCSCCEPLIVALQQCCGGATRVGARGLRVAGGGGRP